jgi:hypothetical protein
MSFERATVGTGLGAEPPVAPRSSETATVAATDPSGVGAGGSQALRLQILSTEHYSLMATRSLAWNESFSRAGMYLTTLSGGMVALALVAQATRFGQESILFALVILPVVLFIGVATFIRLGASNYYDAICIVGMNRIRAAYLEMAPELENYFVMSSHDDRDGVAISMGSVPGRPSLLHIMAATPTVISTVNAVLAGVIVALVGLAIGLLAVVAIATGAGGFLVAMAVEGRYARSTIGRLQASVRPIFPTKASSGPPSDDPTVKES